MGFRFIWLPSDKLSDANADAETVPLPSLTNPVAAWSAHEDDAALLWQDTGKTTQAASDGDVIGAIEQLSGFGATDGTQGTTASKPLLKTGANGINGHWAALFDGADDFWDITGVTAASGAKTFYFVYQPASATSDGTYRFLFDAATGRLAVAHLTDTGNFSAYFDGGWKNIGAAATGAQILSVVLGSGTGTFYRNGASIGSAAYTDNAIGGSSAIGADRTGTNNWLNHLFGFGAVYNAEHSTEERQSMEAHLASKWGISI